MIWKELLFVTLGSGIGGALRYLISVWLRPSAAGFPTATFIANILGCLLIGLLAGLLQRTPQIPNGLSLFLGVGLCGGFGENLSVGDILLPEKIWSEEGASLHYLESPGFAQVTPPAPFDSIASFFMEKEYQVCRKSTVTTDAVYRQTWNKEQRWREMGCVAVDMEASALVNISNLYGIRNTVILMVSDRHPLSADSPAWEWGGADFGEMTRRFILDCVAYAVEPGK